MPFQSVENSTNNSGPQVLNIPSYNSDTLYYAPSVMQVNKNHINDAYIKEQMEIDYTVKHPNSQFQKFNRYLIKYPDDELTTLVPYVFFVRPDLNIFDRTQTMFANDQISGDPTFRFMYSNAREVLRSLTADYSDLHDYIPYLTNKIETFPTFDYSVLANENTQLFTGYRNYYAGNAIASTTGLQFDITFRDDNNLNTLKLFYIWCYYIDGVVRNKFDARYTYKINRIADYYTSIYYFLCSPDAQKIIYFTKIVGAFPTNAPMSLLSMNLPMNPENKISVSFSAFSVEHMNPIILSEFNYNSRINREGTWARPNTLRPISPIPHYDEVLRTGKTMVGTPYIYSDGNEYYLMWNNDL